MEEPGGVGGTAPVQTPAQKLSPIELPNSLSFYSLGGFHATSSAAEISPEPPSRLVRRFAIMPLFGPIMLAFHAE
jgi:hypothetical protein